MKLYSPKSLVMAFFLTAFTISAFSQTLTFSGGVWTPNAPNASTGAQDVIIDDDNAVFANGSVVNNITINANKSIRITNETITANGNLILNTGASIRVTTTGNLNVAGTSSISITGSNSDLAYNIWSSPFPDAAEGLEATFSGVNACDLYTFNTTTQSWRYDYSVGYTTLCVTNSVTFSASDVLIDGVADGNFDIGRGYFVPGNAAATRVLSSTSNFNTGNIAVPIYGSSVAVAGGNDWNLIGNPYPSSIRVDNLLSTNSSLANAVYIYNGASGSYLTKNSTSGYKISPGQGFFIDANTAIDGFVGTFNFVNNQRRTLSYTFEKTDSSATTSVAYISLTNDQGLADYIEIYISDDALDGYDNVFDARKLWNDNGLNLATLIEVDPAFGMEPFVFNGVKTLNNLQTKRIPLFIETNKSGIYEIQIDSISNIPAGLSITLEDLSNNTMTDLKLSEYNFSTSSSSDSLENRFFLNLSYDETITSTNNKLEQNKIISVISIKDQLIVKSLLESEILDITVYNIVGKVKSINVDVNSAIINTTDFAPGIYIVKVTDSNGIVHTSKIYVD